jgi:hypothetical protein
VDPRGRKQWEARENYYIMKILINYNIHQILLGCSNQGKLVGRGSSTHRKVDKCVLSFGRKVRGEETIRKTKL